MALKPEQIDAEAFARWGEMKGAPLAMCRGFARAIEAEVQAQDTALIESQSREIAALKEQVEGLRRDAEAFRLIASECINITSGHKFKGARPFDGGPGFDIPVDNDPKETLHLAVSSAIAAKGGE